MSIAHRAHAPPVYVVAYPTSVLSSPTKDAAVSRAKCLASDMGRAVAVYELRLVSLITPASPANVPEAPGPRVA